MSIESPAERLGAVRSERPGALRFAAEFCFECLESGGRDGVLLEDLAAALATQAVAHGVDPLAALALLAREGRATPFGPRWVACEAFDRRVGFLDVLTRGDALVFEATPRGRMRDASCFVPRDQLKGAISGDLVRFRPPARRAGRGGESRGDRGGPQRLPRVRVERIVEPRSSTIVGTLVSDPNGARRLDPFEANERLPLPVEAADGVVLSEIPDGRLVRCEIVRSEVGAYFRVAEELGDPADPGADARAIAAVYDLREVFPSEVLAAAEGLPNDPRPHDLGGREDLTAQTVVTIDGPHSKDFDDAISAERLPHGGFRIGVHVADVAHWVDEGSALDLEAFRRSTSVYLPGKELPMFPERISHELCSLLPGRTRLALSVFLDLDAAGKPMARRLAATVIRSARRLTYAEVKRLVEERATISDAERANYGPVLDLVDAAHGAMKVLFARRIARGSIDFDLPEGDVELDDDGVLLDILPGERNLAHRIIEEFMVAANETVAEALLGSGSPALYRVNDSPRLDRLIELRDTLAAMGIELAASDRDLENLPTEALQRALAAVQGRPEEPLVAVLVLRSLPRARYTAENGGHYALASPRYLHFTSPIRRYPDLVDHRRVRALLQGHAAAEDDLAARLPGIAEETTAREKRADNAERELLQWKKVRFLAPRVGERFAGRITGIQKFGLFVHLVNERVDGLIPILTLGDEPFRWEPEAHVLIGETSGKTFRLADPLVVELQGVDLRHRGLVLRWAGEGESPT